MLAHPLPADAPRVTPPPGPEPGSPPAARALDARLGQAWRARLRPRDPAEAAVVETIVAGVRRRARIDRLEDRLIEALAEGRLEALPALAALARCRTRIERDRRLALDELRLLRGLLVRPMRSAAGSAPTRPARRLTEAAHAAPEKDSALGPDDSAGRPVARGLPAARAPRTAPAPACGSPSAELSPATASLAGAAAAALPGLWRDFAGRPDWRASTSRYAIEVALMAAGAG